MKGLAIDYSPRGKEGLVADRARRTYGMAMDNVPMPSRKRSVPTRFFAYRGLSIVPSFDDARSREIERGVREVALRLGIG